MMLALVGLVLASLQSTVEREPWIVIDNPTRPPRERYDGVYRPNIAKLGERVLLATYQHTSHYGSYGTHVLRSEDGGATWQHAALVPAARSVELFVASDTAYMLSFDGAGGGARGWVTLRASKDGRVWTGGGDQAEVRLRGDDALDGGRSASFVANGRIWCALSRLRIRPVKADTATSIQLASAALTDDLLDPKSWRWSADFELADTGSDWKWPAILASVLPGKSPRLHLSQSGEGRAIVEIASDGWRLRHLHGEPLFDVPEKIGSAGLVRDDASSAYWALSVSSNRSMTAGSTHTPRNVLTLHRSERLSDWRHVVVVEDQRAKSVDFHDARWVSDGDDLLVTLTGVFPSSEDATKLTKSLVFLRVPRFRDLDALQPILLRDPR